MASERSHLRTIGNQDGAVILNTTSGEIVTLNSTGALIWHALAQDKTPEMITTELASETGQELDSLESDVRQFIASLKKQGLYPG